LSGICGVVRLDGAGADVADVGRALRTLAHLGPDGAESLACGAAAFGWRALRVTREDRHDAQPALKHGLLLVADARLDNRDELAAELGLSGPLDRMPESTLLLAAYRRWGAVCAERLLGDFAFAVWDAERQELTLVRDHMGQRHLFYHRGEGFFAFATEIKGLWALPDVPRAVTERGLARRLLVDGRGDPGWTMFEGIEAVPGGTTLVLGSDGAVSLRRYWSPEPAPIHAGRDEAYYRQAYRDVLGEAVACRVRRASEPPALLMSGGFDSAGIAALAAPALGGRKLIAVASVAPPDAEDGEPSARHWVDICRLGMPHLDVRYVELCGDIAATAPRLALAMDRPASPDSFALDELCRVAAGSGARVLMDGYGGDYTLNPRGGRPLARLLRAGRLGRFWSELRAQQRWRGESLWRALRREAVLPLLPGWLRRARTRRREGLPGRGAYSPVASGLAETPAAQGLTPFGEHGSLAQTALREMSLHTLRNVQDSPTAGGIVYGLHGLELTQPFHDKRVVELALAIPEDLYFKNGKPRHLARMALADLYPPEFQSPPPANIPFIPDYVAVIERARPRLMAEIERLEQNPRLRGYVDFAKIRQMLTLTERDRRLGAGGYRMRQAVRTLLCAHYVDWFRRDNA
jgi:asparagine synthase (glutamine-hydrolysing)